MEGESPEDEEPSYLLRTYPVYQHIGCDSKIQRLLYLGEKLIELARKDKSLIFSYSYLSVRGTTSINDDTIIITFQDKARVVISRPDVWSIVKDIEERKSGWSMYFLHHDLTSMLTPTLPYNKNAHDRSHSATNVSLPRDYSMDTPRPLTRCPSQSDETEKLTKLDKIIGMTKKQRVVYSVKAVLHSKGEEHMMISDFVKTIRSRRSKISLYELYSRYKKLLYDLRTKLLEDRKNLFEGIYSSRDNNNDNENENENDDNDKNIEHPKDENKQNNRQDIITHSSVLERGTKTYKEIVRLVGEVLESEVLEKQLSNGSEKNPYTIYDLCINVIKKETKAYFANDVVNSSVLSGPNKTVANDIKNCLKDYIAIANATNFLVREGLCVYDTFGIKPGLHAENDYIDVVIALRSLASLWSSKSCDELDLIQSDTKTYKPVTPTTIIENVWKITHSLNVLMSEKSVNGLKAKAKGDVFSIGAEDFNPVFEMCLVKANIPEMALMVSYTLLFMDTSLKNTEYEYYIAVLDGSLTGIKVLADEQMKKLKKDTNKIHE